MKNSRRRSVPAEWLEPTENFGSYAPCNKLHPAQNEGPHEEFAQLTVDLHETKQLSAVQLNYFTGLARAVPHKCAPSRKQAYLAGELT